MTLESEVVQINNLPCTQGSLVGSQAPQVLWLRHKVNVQPSLTLAVGGTLIENSLRQAFLISYANYSQFLMKSRPNINISIEPGHEISNFKLKAILDMQCNLDFLSS